MGSTNQSNDSNVSDDKVLVWLDIDNTLYSANSRIADAMGKRIHEYFLSLGLSDEEASDLHLKYYRQYGLALRGLVRHHDIDSLDFDRRCDGSLPLEDMIEPSPQLRKLLEDIDRSKARVWALTNAYITHASRVLRILRVDDLIDDIVFCDYSQQDFTCKPEPDFFNEALRHSGVKDPSSCYFVDDSATNVAAARQIGWGHCVHFCEKGLATTIGGVKSKITGDFEKSNDYATISSLEELRELWPEIFKGTT